jgi:hypothetical protein
MGIAELEPRHDGIWIYGLAGSFITINRRQIASRRISSSAHHQP